MAGDEGDDAAVITRPKEMSPSILYPMLNTTNYTVWALRMKVLLRIHKVWETIDSGSLVSEKNDIAIGLLFQSIPEFLILQVGEQDSPKAIWEAIKSRYLGADRVKEARLQTLDSEFERIKMHDMDTIDSFAGKLSELASRSASLGQTIEESEMSPSTSCPGRAQKIEEANRVETEEAESALYMHAIVFLHGERILDEENHGDTQEKLLYANSGERSLSSSRGRRRGSGGRRNRGRGRGRGRFNSQEWSANQTDLKEKKDRATIICYRGDKPGHFASVCPNRPPIGTQEANKVETEDSDTTLYMHEVVFLNKEKVMPKNYAAEEGERGFWYETDEEEVAQEDRQGSRLTYLDDYLLQASIECERLLFLINDEPSCFKEAKGSLKWRLESKDEINSINKNKTWFLVERSGDTKVIHLKWIFKVKKNADNTMEQATLCWNTKFVLRQAPRCWNAKLDQILKGMGFKKCAKESIVYRKEEGGSLLIIAIYVDDLFVTGNTLKEIDEFKAGMSSKFEVSDLGKFTYYLGNEVLQGEDGIEIKQEGYARQVLTEVDLETCDPIQVPMEFGSKISKTQEGEEAEFMAAMKAIAFTKNHVFHGKKQKADILTKALARIKFVEMRSFIGVQDVIKTGSKLKREIVG